MVALMISCSTNEDKFPFPLTETLNNNGAYLRVISVESAGFNILDLANANFSFVGEAFDRENGDLLESVTFYVKYTGVNGTTVAETTSPVKTVPASAFTKNSTSNLPRATLTVTIDEIAAGIGISKADFLIGDRFDIRWAVNLTSGDSFSMDDAAGDVAGGAFYASPYFSRTFVVAKIPENKFVGNYDFTQLDNGTFGIVYGSAVFTSEVAVDPNNTLNGRTFMAEYLGQFGFDVGPKTHPFAIALANNPNDNSVTLTAKVGAGLGCSALGLFTGPQKEPISTFDISDDSAFTLGITENTEGDCGGSPVQVRFDAAKQ